MINQFPLMTPDALKEALPISCEIKAGVEKSREAIQQVVNGDDPRLLVILGPCSIHDTKAALEYASHLKKAANAYSDQLLIIMRTYFEKPRTTLGWKGFINDPFLDGSLKMKEGLYQARQLLIELNQMGLSTATEFLNPLTASYLEDLISWGAIGARTSASQLHRELASSLPFSIGFKNSIDGNIKIATDAVHTARCSHTIFKMSEKGTPVMAETPGNPFCHIILRGAETHTNYKADDIKKAVFLLKRTGLVPRLMVDCSHGNSQKNQHSQKETIHAIIQQLRENPEHPIMGIMIESYLVAGKQSLIKGCPLVYGQSITDECLSWQETLPLLETLAAARRTRARAR